MTTTAVLTPGTKLYVLDASVSPHVVVAVLALQGFTPAGGGKRSKIPISNFDSAGYNENVGGRAEPNEASGKLILLKSDASHQALKRIMEAQVSSGLGNAQFFLGDNDSTSPPTVVTDTLTPPQTASPKHWARSGLAFEGYISQITPTYEDDKAIMADFSVQVSGKTTWYVKGDVIAKTY